MELYLIRHAEALDGVPDEARPLSSEGWKTLRRAVKTLDHLGIRWDRLLHSPLRRAVETAEALMPLVRGESEVAPWLAHPWQELPPLTGERVALVGHQPWLGELVSWLWRGEREEFPIRKGGLVWLKGSWQRGGMELLALIPPQWW